MVIWVPLLEFLFIMRAPNVYCIKLWLIMVYVVDDDDDK